MSSILSIVLSMLTAASVVRPQTTVGPENTNEIRYASAFSGTDAGARISAAIADAPIGGTVDTRGLEDGQVVISTIKINKRLTLILGMATSTCAASPCIHVTADGVNIHGQGQGQTILAAGQGAAAVIDIDASNVQVSDLSITNPSNISSSNGMIVADLDGASQARNITIERVMLNGGTSTHSSFRRGIIFRNVTTSAIRDNQISGVEVPAAGPNDAYAIYLRDRVTITSIERNRISFAEAGANADVGFRVGILLQSPMVDSFNGQVSGATPLPQTTTDILLADNSVYRGTHAYSFQNVARVAVTGNSATQQIRQLIAFATNADLTIAGNAFHTASSTNMAFDYGNVGLTITGNTCDTTTGGEGSSIELYYNNANVIISGNTLVNFAANGVLVAYKAQNISVRSNAINSAVPGVVGVHVVGALGPSYPVALASPDVHKITVKDNHIHVPTTRSSGVLVLSKETGSTLDPVNITELVVDENEIVAGGYGVAFIKNGGTGAFTPAMGDHNVLVGSPGFPDGPFASDLPRQKKE